LCGAPAEDSEKAKVWAVHEVLEYDPTLKPFIEKPPGIILRRPSGDAEWQVDYDESKI
jgi:hypothetical protein